MQIPGRYILSNLCDTLSIHVLVLCMAHQNQLFTLEQTWQVALCVYAWNILLAYLCLKFYDEPVRKHLARRFLSKNGKGGTTDYTDLHRLICLKDFYLCKSV